MSDVTETRAGARRNDAEAKIPGVVAVFCETAGAELCRATAVRAECCIGRDPTAGFFVDDTQISRKHAMLRTADGVNHVADLGSRNGTYDNGARAEAAGTLAPFGSIIRCGRTLFLVERDIGPFQSSAAVSTEEFVGGPRMVKIWDVVRHIAPLAQPVLVLGETGTGKEVVARALHEGSGRRGDFCSVNCGAIPADLVESELFGHARGAFSGSTCHRKGLFRVADQGTLLLDELGELPLPAQTKLLRVIEQGQVRAVGDDHGISIDTRVVGATNTDLDRLVQEGQFRTDLYHRIAVWQIRLPPLRDHIEDVPMLASHFLKGASTPMSVEAMEQLMMRLWPGNVRELRNVVATASARALHDGQGSILIRHLPAPVAPAAPAPKGGTPPDPTALRTRIETALTLVNGNVSHAAKHLGCTRPWLYLTVKKLGIDLESFRRGQ